MLSLQRNSGVGGITTLSNHHMTPWFARPVVQAGTGARPGVQRSLSPNMSPDEDLEDHDLMETSNSSTEFEQSFYEPKHPHADLINGCEKSVFRNRYPPVFRKKRHSDYNNPKNNICDELDLPLDPRTWTRDDVETWIRYMACLHNLPSIQCDRFLMNGKALCLMNIDMFCQRVPLGGKMLFKDFQLRLSMAMYQSSRC